MALIYRIAGVHNTLLKHLGSALSNKEQPPQLSEGNRLGFHTSTDTVGESGYLYGNSDKTKLTIGEIDGFAKQAYGSISDFEGGSVGAFAHYSKLVLFIFCPILLIARAIADRQASKDGGS